MSTTAAPTQIVEDESPPTPVGRSPFELPPLVQQLLGYAGFAYVVGFVTLVANTARYGIPLQEFAKPLTIWAGAIPTITVFLTIYFYRKRLEGHPENAASLRQVAGDLFIVAVCVAVGRVFLWYFEWAVRLESRVPFLRWWDKHSLAGPWLDKHPVIATVIFFIYSAGVLIWQQRMNWKNIAGKLKERFLRYGPSVFMAVTLSLYIWVGYPEWPQQYGFGRPETVRLLVSADSSLPLSGAASSATSLRTTAPLDLLFHTDSEYVVQYWVNGQPTVVSVDASEIKGTIWK